MSKLRRLICCAACLLWGSSTALADQARPIDYLDDVRPILRSRCWSCHGGLKQEAGLRLDTGQHARVGGENGRVVVPGKPDQSALIERVSATDDSLRMPPEGKPLSADEIRVLRSWIEHGAASPADETPQNDPRRHWAFQRPVRRPLPDVPWQSAEVDEVRFNPVDAFIARRHASQGLVAASAAERRTLIRRLALDLIGLPPAAEDVHMFVADDAPDATERLVDRLLESPAHGERWGRHWMDVWRYSDWYGRRRVNDVRNSHPEIWRWRDWIVRSLNKDTGYDEMLRMMLAADELDPANDENIVALGFIVRNWFSLNYDTWMQDQVEHTGKAFLGLRLNCAHCHDHKYDPITQEEYFRFRAFFEPVHLRQDRVPGGPDVPKYARYVPGSGASLKPIGAAIARVYDEYLDAETRMYRLGDARDLMDLPPVTPGAPAILGGDQLEIQPVDLPARSWYPGLKEFVRTDGIGKRKAAITAAEATLVSSRSSLADSEPQLVAAVDASDAMLAEVKRKLSDESRLSRALAGEQSLVMDGSTGRRCLANTLPGVTTIDDGTQLRYVVRLQTDTWSALGLVLDRETGLTGGYVAIRKGQVVTYRAGQRHAEFAVATYDIAKGRNTFEVTLDLQPSQDRFLLTVVSLASSSEPTVLVDHVPAALHGWNRATNPGHVLCLDARAGAHVVVDNIELGPSDGVPVFRCDFEPPDFHDSQDVSGKHGWIGLKWTAAPATSRVSRLIESSPELRQAEQENLVTRRALEAARINVTAAEKRLEAARLDLAAFVARVEAERQRYLSPDESPGTDAVRDAVVAERRAGLLDAEAAMLEATVERHRAEALPLTDDKRTQAVQAAQKKVGVAETARNKARQASDAIDDKSTLTPLSPTYHRTSTGRRRALALWMTDRKNPLPARVAVNHMWLRHFGTPLVESVLDFGNSGSKPTHPELLDWLAVEFVESGWSMKRLHRLIVTSRTYRMSSQAGNNTDYVCFVPRRLEAEAVRDAILFTAGQLDRVMGGQVVTVADESTSARRSLYFPVYPEDGGVLRFLSMFDAPDPCDCYQRTTTIVPQQALAMNNSRIIQEASRTLAESICGDMVETALSNEQLVRLAFEACLGRQCTNQELQASSEFLDRQQALYETGMPEAGNVKRAVASLIRVLFSHNDFVTTK